MSTSRSIRGLQVDFGTWKSFGYDANGSLTGDDRRVYQYNSVGQLTALGDGITSSPCRYDAMGRRVLRCPGVGGPFPPEIWAGYDGENLIRFKDQAATQPVWRFVHGPGLDDPLVALKRDIGTQNYAKYYYLSDGQGREYAFTDAQGYDQTPDVAYWQNGGNQSGAVSRATGFDNQRATSGTAPDISFYRNRYYDQKTGRWTQEDPIGIAGGTNLYLYAGNNPATFMDPFGLNTDTLEVFGSNLADALKELADKYPEVAAALDRLHKSTKRFVMIGVDEFAALSRLRGFEGFTVDRSQHAVVLELEEFAPGASGYALVSAERARQGSGRPTGVIGFHESIHLLGIALRGRATRHEDCRAWLPEVRVARGEGTRVDVSVARACGF